VSSLTAVARGAAVALLGSVLGGGLGFAFTIVMARMLSPGDFGLLVLAVTLLQFGSALALAGMDYAAVRDVAAATGAGRKRGAMVTPLAVALALNAILALLVAALAAPLAHALGEPRFTSPLRAVALVLPLTVAAQMLSACLSGLELARGEVVRKVVEQGSRIALGALAVALGLGVTGVVLGLAAAAAAAAVAVAVVLLRVLPRGGRVERTPVRRVLGFAWPQAAANVLALAQVPGVLVLSHERSSRDVAIFGAAIAVGLLPALVYNAFAYRFSPTIARLWSAGDIAQLSSLLQGVTRWIAFASLPFYAVAISLAAPLLRIYGDGYVAGATALALVAATNGLNALTGPVEWALIMTGRVRLELLANAVGAVALVAATLVFVPRWGVSGAAAALVLYGVAMNGLKSLFVLRQLHMTTLSLRLLPPLLAAVVACAAGSVATHTTSLDTTPAGIAALAVLVVACYALLALPAARSELRALREAR
jgi:O-antigen/teichoic acid export membrane protein